MAELSVGTLQMEITADGSAAISELERVQGTAENVAGSLSGLGDGADLSGVAEGASGAAEGLEGVAGASEGAAQGVEGAGQAAERAGVSIKELGEGLTKAGESMTKFVTLPIAGLMTAAVAGASDFTETMGKTEVVFGDMTDRVMAWSETSVQAMGLAQGSALEFAGTYGDMATGMGLAQSAAADMAMSLTQLAADLASFKNISTDLAAQKLNAIFTGETEGLKSLGIVMTQTNLQAFAMSQGIDKSVSSMSQAEQVMLRYKYVMEATKNAQGDFARTGDSLANQTRKLGETVKQMGESFGARLVPMVTPVVEKLQQFAQGLAEMDGGAKNTIIAIAGVAAAIGPLLLVGGKLLTFIASVKAALAALTVNPVILGLTAIAAAVAGVVALKGALDDANMVNDEQYQHMKETMSEHIETQVDIALNGEEQLERVESLDGSAADMAVNVEAGGDGLEAVDRVEDADGETATATVTVGADGDGLEAVQKVDEADGKAATATVTITEGGGSRLADIDSTLDDIVSGGPYSATVTIGGERTGVDTAIAGIQTDIAALKAQVKITADGSAVIGEGAQSAIGQIKAKIEALKAAVSVEMDGDKKAALLGDLATLQSQLDALGAGKTVTVSYTETGDAAANAKTFADAVAALPNGDTYSATGEFVYSDTTQKLIDDYVNALNSAADATGNYKDHVAELQQSTDKIYDEREAEVYAQQGEKVAALNAAYNEGLISRDQYVAGLQREKDAAQEEIKTLNQQREAAKQLADQLANGTEADDAATQADLMHHLDPNARMTEEQRNANLHRLQNADESGEDMGQYSAEGAIAAGNAVQAAAGQFEQAQAAVEAYRQSMGDAAQAEADAETAYSKRQEQIGQMTEAYDAYLNQTYAGIDAETAMASATEAMDPAAAQAFTAALTDASGSLMDYDNAKQRSGFLDELAAEAEEKHTQALADAKTAREDATKALQESIETAQGANLLGKAEDAEGALSGLYDTIDRTGAAVGEGEKAMVLGTQELVDGMAEAIRGGDVEGAIQQLSDSVEGGLGNSLEDATVSQPVTVEAEPVEAGEVPGQVAEAAEEAAQEDSEPVETTRDANVGAGEVNAEELKEGIEEATDSAGDESAAATEAVSATADISMTIGSVTVEGSADVGAAIGEQLSGQTAPVTVDVEATIGSVTLAGGSEGGSIGDTIIPSPQTASPTVDVAADVGSVTVSGAEAIGTAIDDGAAGAMTGSATTDATTGAVGAAIDAGTGAAGGASAIGTAMDSAAAGALTGGALSGAASGAVAAAISAGSGAAGGASAIGAGLMQGATQGVMSAAGRLADAAAKAVRDAVAAAKKAADINSPSRVMDREVGAMLTRGIAQGVTREVPGAKKRIQAATRDLMSGAAGVVDRGTYTLPALPGAAVDYGAMGAAMRQAMDGVGFSFSVGERELARAQRTEAARAQVFRARQIDAGYGMNVRR